MGTPLPPCAVSSVIRGVALFKTWYSVHDLVIILELAYNSQAEQDSMCTNIIELSAIRAVENIESPRVKTSLQRI